MKQFLKKLPVRWRKVLIRAAVGLAIGLVMLLICLPRLLGWIIGHELHSQLAQRMNARLNFNRVVYKYPYGVLIEKAHLLLPAANGGVDSWIDVGRLQLTLAKLPLGTGPLVIEKLAIDDPMVHLSSSFGSGGSTAPAPVPAQNTPPQKLSDLFQLRNVSIARGRFEYDFSQEGHPVPPVVWGNLNCNMNTLPTAGGLYQFAIAIQDQPVVSATATGSFDIDSLELKADKVNVAIACDPSQHARQIPPRGLAFIDQYQLAGQLSVAGSADVPLHDPDHARFTVAIDLQNAHCRPPGFAAPITPAFCTFTATQTDGPCKFDFQMQDQNIAAANASGLIDLNSLLLDLQKFSITLHCDPAKPITQLPASVADVLAKTKTGGEISLDGIARVSLLTPELGWYAANLSLHHGQCQPPGWSGPVTPASFTISASNAAGALPTALPPQPPELHLQLQGLTASCGNQIFKIDGGEATFNPATTNWTARKFHGLADIGDGPGPLEGDNTRLFIPFILSGNGHGLDPDSSVRMALDDASASLTPNHVHINRINGMLTATPTGLRSSGLVAKCAEGQINAIVHLDWQNAGQNAGQNAASIAGQTPPVALAYDGEIQIQQLDLHQLAIEYTTDPAVRQEAFGQLDFNSSIQGSILQNSPPSGPDSVADRLSAQGDFDISHGHFIDIPILRDLLVAMHSPTGSTVGEAAATFNIAHSVINLDRTGASSPVLGIQGGGTLTFDRQVNMNFVATPLADWARDVKGAGLLSDVGAAIVGKAQDVVNGLQRAIYQFRVTGNLSKPKVEPVVIPFLTDKMGPLFQKMAGDQSTGSIAAELRRLRGDSDAK